MDLLDASLGDIAARLRQLLDDDRAAVGADGSGDALLEHAHNWEAIGQAGDAARTWIAAEIAHESRRGDLPHPLRGREPHRLVRQHRPGREASGGGRSRHHRRH